MQEENESQNSNFRALSHGNSKTQKTYKILKALYDCSKKNKCLQYDKTPCHINQAKETIRLNLNITDPHAVNSWVYSLFDIKILERTENRHIYALNNRILESHLTLLQNLHGEKTPCNA